MHTLATLLTFFIEIPRWKMRKSDCLCECDEGKEKQFPRYIKLFVNPTSFKSHAQKSF